MSAIEFVVRDQRRGQGKFHLAADSTLTATLCGRTPGHPGAFTVRGDREAFEELCPDRICKLCRAAEDSSEPPQEDTSGGGEA